MPEGVGEKLDRFELISELASGGMATVFLARLSGAGGFQRLYAIKRLHPHLANDNEFIQMFLDEARLAARIHHPNVVPILEIGTDAAHSTRKLGAKLEQGGYYLVMEYIEGDTAARLFARSATAGTKLAINVGIRIFVDALAGLHAAHEMRDDDGKPLEIVHRDVSPQNILVGVDGISRITDFGVARAASRLSTTRTGQLKGKLAYMAPEQARAGKIDRRADVFAAGICLWETLAFRRLFKGDGEAETLNRVLYDPIPTLASVAPSTPRALNDVVMKALERDPDKRYTTAAELGAALEKVATDLGLLGTTREVAACVEHVMGTELTQQRAAVRAWSARSDPNRSDPPGPERAGAEARTPAPSAATAPPRRESVTKVERAASTRPPPHVSSVSSAILQVPPPESTGAIGALDRSGGDADRNTPVRERRKRAGLWVGAIALAAPVLAFAAIGLRQAPARDGEATLSASATLGSGAFPPPAAAHASPQEAASVTPAAAGAALGHAASPVTRAGSPVTGAPVGSAASIASALLAVPAPAPAPHRSRRRATHAVAQEPSPPPSQAAAPPAVKPAEPSVPAVAEPQAPVAPMPDDITHNPYR